MSLAADVHLTCFAASYAVALVLESVRTVRRDRWVRWSATGFVLAGLAAHTLYLANLALTERRLPIASPTEALLTVGWLVVLIHLYLMLRDRRILSGLFVLPVTLALVLYAPLLTGAGAGARNLVATAHGILLLVGTVLVIGAMLAGLMHFLKVHQLKHRRVRGPVRLPSLERIERINTTCIWLAWPHLTLGIGLGFAVRAPNWADAKVWVTLLAWTLFTVLTHARFNPANRGRRMATMTLVAGGLVLFSVLGDPLFGTSHQRSETQRGEAVAAVGGRR